MDTSTSQATLPPPPPPPGPPHKPPRKRPARSAEETARSAAQWLGGTGAVLLLVAAAVLVAVRWDDLTALMKLSGLVITNGAILLSGLRLRSSIPATARALYHLGALLIPISTVAIGIQAGVSWQWTLLGSSVITIGSLFGLQRVEPSGLIRVLAAATVIPLAGGLAATTGAPAGVLLAGASIVAVGLPPFRKSPEVLAPLVWATAGVAIAFLVGVDDPFINTTRVMTELGLGSSVPTWAYLATGLVSALTFGLVAHRHDDEALAFMALAAALSGLVATALDLDMMSYSVLTGAVALAVALQFAELMTRGVRPWNPVLAPLAALGEIVMVVATFSVTGAAGVAVDTGTTGSASAIAKSALLVGGWLVADHRRRLPDCQPMSLAFLMGGGWWPATVGTAAATVALAATTTGSTTIAAWTAVAVAVLLVPSGRAGSHVVAVGLGVAAMAMTTGGWFTVSVAATIALTLAAASALRSTSVTPADAGARALMLTSLAFVLGGTVAMIDLVDRPELLWLAWVGGTLACTIIGERATTNPFLVGTGLIGRIALTAVFVPPLFDFVWAGLLPAVLVVMVLVAVDLYRSRDDRLASLAAPLLPAAIILALHETSLSTGEMGVALAIAATSVAGALVAMYIDIGRWIRPAALASGLTAMAALVFSSQSPGHLSTTLLILGGALLTVAIDRRSLHTYMAGGLTVTLGLWLRLGLMEVVWTEAYVAPLALLLIVLGINVSNQGVASWWTHGTAVVLLGGAALIERVAGGSGAHGLLAGTVTVVAVILGAQHRLIGPLASGTVLIFAVAAHESLVYAATVPTWAWLALAGSVLLGGAVFVERTATSPLESGRKMLETMQLDYR